MPLGFDAPTRVDSHRQALTSCDGNNTREFFMRHLRTLGFAVALVGVMGFAGCATGPDIRVDKDPTARHVRLQDVRLLRRSGHGSSSVLHDHHQPPQAGDHARSSKQGIPATTRQNPDLKANFYLQGAGEAGEIQSTRRARGWNCYGYRAG